jgi:hypothetical protein
MFKYLIAALLLAASFNIVASQDLFLSPAYPPTAFLSQYYEVIFRVRGLNYPTFTFDNLPDFLTGKADGSVSGTPTITGTFKITVTYTDGNTTQSVKVVVSVANGPNTPASQAQSQAVVNLIVQTVASSWIYRVGSKISIQLNSANGVAPITWNYKNLPSGLSGDNSGLVQGSVHDNGLYTFSASVGDSKGQTAEAYYTLNVQPGTLIKSISVFIQPTTSSMFPSTVTPLSTTSLKLRLSRSPPMLQ